MEIDPTEFLQNQNLNPSEKIPTKDGLYIRLYDLIDRYNNCLKEHDVAWFLFEEKNFDKFKELTMNNKCLCRYDNGIEIPFNNPNHPYALMTHFSEIK